MVYQVCDINSGVQVVETNNPFLVDAKDVALVIVKQDKPEHVVLRIKLLQRSAEKIVGNVGMEV